MENNMHWKKLNKIKRKLEEMKLSNLEYFKNEDGDCVFVSDECFIVINDNMRFYIDFVADLYPDSAANITLEIYDLTKKMNGDIIINDVFAIDDKGEICFGDEAREAQEDEVADFINKQVEDVLHMDHVLMTNKGYDC
jgi:hypothetical protein